MDIFKKKRKQEVGSTSVDEKSIVKAPLAKQQAVELSSDGENQNSETVFKSILSKLSKALKVVKSKEEARGLGDLDAKLIASLEKSGQTELAKKLTREVSKANRKGTGVKFSSLSRNRWFTFGLSFLSVAVFVFVGTVLVLNYLEGNGKNQLSDLKNSQATPAIALRATQKTESGYVAPQSKFEITFDSKPVSNLEKSIVVSPTFKYDIKVEEKDGKQNVIVIPKDDLKRDVAYTVSISEGTSFEDGSKLLKDLSWVVKVEPEFALLTVTPRDTAVNVPVNSVIEMTFNHRNLDVESIKQHFTISPEIKGRFEIHGLKVVFIPETNFSANTDYTVFLNGDYANLDGEKLGKTISWTFNASSEGTINYIGSIYWRNNGYQFTEGIENTTSGMALSVWTSRINGNITYTVYSADFEKALPLLQDGRYLKALPNGVTKISSKELSSEEDFSYIPKANGLYIISAQAKGESLPIYKYFIKTDLNLVGKLNSESSMAYLYDMKKATPVSGATLTSYNKNIETKVATTGKDGSAKLGEATLIVAKLGDQYAVLDGNSHNAGWYGYGNSSTKATIRLDKPVYKPGDVLRFDGVVREIVESEILVPTSTEKLTVKAYAISNVGYHENRANTALFEKEISFDTKFGVYSGKFDIPSNLDAGHISIEISYKGREIASEWVAVTDYVAPKEKYTISYAKEFYNASQSATLTVAGEDYAGRPLTNKNVKVTYYVDTVDDPFTVGISSSRGYVSRDSEIYSYSEFIKLDSKGRFTNEIKLADVITNSSISDVNAPIYGILTVLEPVEEEMFIDQTQVQIFYAAANYDVGVKDAKGSFVNYVAGDSFTAEFSSAKLWDESAVAGKKVEFEIFRSWHEKVQNGTEYDEVLKTQQPKYESIYMTESYAKSSVVLDAKGRANYELKNIKEGAYRVNWSFEDGRFIRKDLYIAYVYTAGTDFSYVDEWMNTHRIVKLDGGDSSQLTVGMKYPLTLTSKLVGKGFIIASNNTIIENSQVEVAAEKPQNLSFNITDKYFPSANICVFLVIKPIDETGVIGSKWGYDCIDIGVVDESIGFLDVSITTDKETYKPGDTVKGTVKVKNGAGGKIEEGNVAIRVVDQALLDAYGDMYLSYDAYGVNDSSDDKNAPYELRNSIYQSLKASSSWLMGSVYRIDDEGGMGAGGDGDGESIRTKFNDSIYWNPELKLNSNGEATFEFTAPAILTTWDIQAVAVDDKDRFGINSYDFKSTLARSIDVRLPSFVRVGDSFDAEVFVDNFEGKFDGTIEVKCAGCTEESKQYEISLDSNDQATVIFPVSANKGVERLTISSKLFAKGEFIDGVEREIKVQPDGVQQSVFTIGSIDGKDDSFVTEVDFGEQFDKDTSQLAITVSKRFSFGSYVYPVDPSSKATRELAYSILTNSYIYKNYDLIKPEGTSKEDLLTTIKFAYDQMRANIIEDGGFGEYDYTGSDLASSVEAAQALVAMEQIGISVANTEKAGLGKYFNSVIESKLYSSLDKVNALRGYATIYPTEVFVYLGGIEELMDSTEKMAGDKTRKLSENPLAISWLMQMYNAIGSTGDSANWAKKLVELATTKNDVAYWHYEAGLNGEKLGDGYVTSQAYLALHDVEEWKLKYQVRNWFINSSAISNSTYFEYGSVLYSILMADEGLLESNGKPVEFEVLVNGRQINPETLVIDKKSNASGVTVKVDSKELRAGKNRVEVATISGEDLYITVNHSYVTSAVSAEEKVEISKKFYNLYTGKEISITQFNTYQPTKVEITVSTKDKAVYNGVIRDYLPSGFTAVDFANSSVSSEMQSQLWSISRGSNSNNWGAISRDSVTFNSYEMKPGEKYTFSYVMMPRFIGRGSTGATAVYSRESAEIIGILSGDIYIVNK